MFILRVIYKIVYPTREDVAAHSEFVEHNEIIGDSYNIIRKESEPVEFANAAKAHNANHPPDPSTFAFIVYDSGQSIRPLYKKQQNYIMTDTGKTFSNIKE